MMPNYAYWAWNYTHAPSWKTLQSAFDTTNVILRGQRHSPTVLRTGRRSRVCVRVSFTMLSLAHGPLEARLEQMTEQAS